MKSVRSKLLAALGVIVACFTLVAFGQVVRPLPVPAFFQAANGDYFGVNSSAKPVLRVGTNSYTGSGTNFYFSNGTNGLRINNGIVTVIGP